MLKCTLSAASKHLGVRFNHYLVWTIWTYASEQLLCHLPNFCFPWLQPCLLLSLIPFFSFWIYINSIKNQAPEAPEGGSCNLKQPDHQLMELPVCAPQATKHLPLPEAGTAGCNMLKMLSSDMLSKTCCQYLAFKKFRCAPCTYSWEFFCPMPKCNQVYVFSVHLAEGYGTSKV